MTDQQQSTATTTTTEAMVHGSYSLPPRRFASVGGGATAAGGSSSDIVGQGGDVRRRHPPRLNRSLTRADSIRQAISTGTASFFGIAGGETEDMGGASKKWDERRRRHCSRRYGGVKFASPERGFDHSDGTRTVPRVIDPLAAGALYRNVSSERRGASSTIARRDSVAKLAWDGLATLVRTGTFRARSRTMPTKKFRDRPYSRSFTPSVVAENSVFEQQESVDGIPAASPAASAAAAAGAAASCVAPARAPEYIPMATIAEGRIENEAPSPSLDDEVFFDLGAAAVTPPAIDHRANLRPIHVERAAAAIRARPYQPPEVPTPTSEGWSWIVRRALEHAGRRHYRPKSLSARLFGRLKRLQSTVSGTSARDDVDDFRPFFTYWVTAVQILVMIVAIAVYRIGPFGFSRTSYSAMVFHTSLVLEHVAYNERDNFWLGPRFADLVHLGAKYAPCMRRDENFVEANAKIKTRERETACCFRHDGTGCVQTTANDCPSSLASWLRWTPASPGPDGRTSGSVCGQDPGECVNPASVSPFAWPDDITNWPICMDNRERANFTNVVASPSDTSKHMTCEITGRPCCIGIQGECRITTREYCDFVRGYFHEEATLCSQVHCFQDVCGMIPFADPEKPDQFYRLLLAMFLHAGVFHLLCTTLVQYFLMRDLEKLIGWVRMAIVYLISGIGGNLASCVFVPYEAEVGPAGAHFGLVAALFVDAIYSWRILPNPWKAMGQLTAVLIVLFALGLLPWVDNYAHLFGFAFGFLLSLALFPYIQMGDGDERRRIIKRAIVVCVCLLLVAGLFAMLFVLFYEHPLRNCDSCVYFNCIPITDHFCDNQGLTLQITPV